MATVALVALVGAANLTGAAATAATIAANVVGGIADQFLSQLFAPKPPDIEGPRLDSAFVGASAIGQEITRIYGFARIDARGPIWQTDFREVETEEEVGGKGAALGGGGQTQRTYEYFASFEHLVGFGPVDRLPSILANGQAFDLEAIGAWEFYDGNQTAANPTREAVEGAIGDFAPTYHGFSYVAFDEVSLNQFGNAIPQISFVAERDVGGTLRSTLAAIAADYGRILDVSAVPNIALQGYSVIGEKSPRAAIAGLATLFQLELAELDDGGYCISPRFGGPDFIIDEQDMVEFPVERIARPDDAPTSVTLSFVDPDRSYSVNAITVSRSGVGRTDTKQTPAVLTAQEAHVVAARALEESNMSRRIVTGRFSMSDTRRIRVGHIVQFVETDLTVKVIRISDEHTGDFEGRVVPNTLAQVVPVNSSVPPRLLFAPPVAPSVAFMDLPLLREGGVEHTPWVAAWGNPGHQTAFYRSFGGVAFAFVSGVPLATTGVLTAGLNAGPEWDVDAVLDGQTLTVQVDDGRQLVSATASQLDGGANALAVQATDGEWEILQFETATLIAPGQYDLTGLRRALRGTDGQMVHSAGARAILLNGAIGRVDYPLVQRGKPAEYRYGPSTRAVDDVLFAQVSRSFSGVGLRPFSPIDLKVVREGNNDLTISWSRRDRNDFDPSSAKPMSEMSEEYDVEITSGAGRTLSSGSESVVYSSADQTVDGLALTAPTLEFEVFQVSQTFGRGTGRRKTITIT